MQIEIHPYLTQKGLQEQLNLDERDIKINQYQAGGIWFPKTTTLFFGTFPPSREYLGRKGYIHYSSAKNQYWKHIDAIYNQSLYINSKKAKEVEYRIANALSKIDFAKGKNYGFVDIYSKIKRKVEGGWRDTEIISIETIFENEIFEQILNSNVRQFACVYKLAFDTIIEKLRSIYSIPIKILRAYNFENIPLEVQQFKIKNKMYFVSYCPIHGKITWEAKQKALKKVIEHDFE